MSHNDCLIQGKVVRFQVLLDSLYPRSMRASWWSPVLQEEAVKILASVSSAFTQCGRTVAESCGARLSISPHQSTNGGSTIEPLHHIRH